MSGSRSGVFVTAATVVIAFIALPLARPFLLGTLGLGLLVGFVLWWQHSRQQVKRDASKDKTELIL